MMKKKYVVVCIAGAVLLASCSQKETGYDIQGNITIPHTATEAVLLNFNMDTLATAPIQEGKFHLEGRMQQPTKARVAIGESVGPELVLENDSYTASIDSNGWDIKGGEIHTLVNGYKDQTNYQEALADYRRTADSVFAGIDMMDKEAVEQARSISGKKQAVVFNLMQEYQRDILEGDYSAWVKLFVLSDNYDWDNYDVDKRFALFDRYEAEIGPNPFLTDLRNRFLEMQKEEKVRATVAAGKPFKEVVAKTADGKTKTLSEVIADNEYTLLEFWASWCGPCRGEFPHLKKAYGEYHPKGFEIFALSLDSKPADWIKAMEEENVPWINTVDHLAFKAKAAQDYAVSGIPASFLISNDGVIVASGNEVRGFALDEKLKAMFDESN